MEIGYARVSTEDQSLDIQVEQLVAAGCERVFSEKRSGTTTDGRTELESALEFARDGDTFICTRLDRVARSLVDLRSIINRLEAKKVGFRCIQQNMDTTTSEGRLMLNILGAFAEFETDIRRDRQREGIARAKAAGRYSGGKPKVSASDIERLRDDEGLKASEIAAKLGISKASVYRLCDSGWGPSPIPR